MGLYRVAVVGGAGYAGEELVRILSRHPGVALTQLTSRMHRGERVREVISGLPGAAENLVFEEPDPSRLCEADVIFLALPHGAAAEYVVPLREAGKIVVDLSADFRLRNPRHYEADYGWEHPAPALLSKAVYALPELHRAEIRHGDLLAAPGCYPTSILLGLSPALGADWLREEEIVANSLSGTSGAGRRPEVPLLFSEMCENARPYGIPRHRHMAEMEQELDRLAGRKIDLVFIPHLIPLARGILSTIVCPLRTEIGLEEMHAHYVSFYRNDAFVRVLRLGELPAVRDVVRTNRADIGLQWDGTHRRLLVFCAIDNLGKGAAGQAVQAMNLRLGLPEEEGLLR
ncbi:N-acetyl-gamma-glutamyl-phosphate reductase [Methylacidimicrobium cyclopophantes]|uniref:N-acetyl-gamma-glutamyl-phosphate reductase n=1 Tax=Methylacidimicrobium cyclopophantes TaxID=1041766 RepID=A0A5E6M7B9_9BACT|nr:N-acetyl-gamma-glutamyl-phosphate reductase [Methylacidimicrobium cyclopophantes]VVM05430.1 N-acetyl-gamma-glutamyl-phosphate reductase [Methylacidimicrobium cyclopophantes]